MGMTGIKRTVNIRRDVAPLRLEQSERFSPPPQAGARTSSRPLGGLYKTIPANNYGFTLPEILIAVLITGMIFTYIFGVLTTSLSTGDEIKHRMEINHIGRYLIGRIAHDVGHATLMGKREDGSFTGRFVGHHYNRDGKSRDEFHFTAFTRSYIGTLGFDKQIDQSEIGYYFRTDRDSGGYSYETLVRRESDLIDPPVDEGGYGLDVTYMVRELSIKYLSDNGWIEEWDSVTTDALPQAVSVELTLADGKKEYFFSSITKVMADEIS